MRKEVRGSAGGGGDKGSGGSFGRRWGFRVAAAVLVPLVFLCLLELCLRIIGYGYPTKFFKPVRFGQEAYLVENDKFGWRFFPPELSRSPPPVRVAAHKPAGTCRVFVLGESAALGDPRPAYGAGRYLQALLEERFPQNKFEVVCVAMTAINSHAVREIAGECARLEGDAWVIYMGNNEMVGPFGLASVFGAQAPGLTRVRLSLALQRTRVGQLLEGISRGLRGGNASRQWAGMEMFTSNRVAPGDTRRAVVYRNFQRNLEAIMRDGTGSGTKVLLNTVAVNLRDCPPFASVLSPKNEEERTACEQLAEEGATAGKTNYALGVAYLSQAIKLDPRWAGLRFEVANCLLGLTNALAAREQFEAARDLDALPFRADSVVNQEIEAVAKEFPGVTLLDAEALLAAASPVVIPGQESFYEHVHLNFDGNYRLARAWAEQLAQMLPGLKQPARSASAPYHWAPQEICERRLGLTDWNRASVLEDVLRRLAQPPLSSQWNNPRRQETYRAELNRLRQGMTTNAQAQAREVYVEALGRAPADHRLHENYAEFLEATGDLAGATAEWVKVRELLPQHHLGYYQTGRLLLRQGKLAEAREQLLAAVARRPDLSEGWLELGNAHVLENQPALALPEYERAKRLQPQDPRPCYHAGKALSKLGRQAEAVRQLREAVRLRPSYWEARYALGEELAFMGNLREAQTQFEEVLRLAPNYPLAHLNLGVALAKEKQLDEAIKQFEEAQRLDPKDARAPKYLEELRRFQSTNGPGKGP